jgi:hypothetical protein
VASSRPAAALAAACGENKNGNPDGGATSKATIGASGGTVSLAGTKLEVPAGALASDVQIEIQASTAAPPYGIPANGPVFKFEPSGTVFAVPVTVTLPLTQSDPHTSVFLRNGSTVENVSGTVSGDTIVAQISHFTEVGPWIYAYVRSR